MPLVIPYADQAWTDGSSDVSAARMLVLEAGIKAVSLAPSVRVTHSTTQSHTTSGTYQKLAFNTERWDQAAGAADTMHDTVTNNTRLTCRYAGVYMIGGEAIFAANATGAVRVGQLLVNNTTVIADSPHGIVHASQGGRVLVTTTYLLAVNDYVEFQVFQDSGGALTVTQGAAFTPEFWMTRIA